LQEKECRLFMKIFKKHNYTFTDFLHDLL